MRHVTTTRLLPNSCTQVIIIVWQGRRTCLFQRLGLTEHLIRIRVCLMLIIDLPWRWFCTENKHQVMKNLPSLAKYFFAVYSRSSLFTPRYSDIDSYWSAEHATARYCWYWDFWDTVKPPLFLKTTSYSWPSMYSFAMHSQFTLRLVAYIFFPISYKSACENNLMVWNRYRLSLTSPQTVLLAQSYMLDFVGYRFHCLNSFTVPRRIALLLAYRWGY